MKTLAFLKEDICEFGTYSQLRAYDGASGCQTAYFFLMEDGSLRVRCGLFGGSMQDWQREIMEKYGKSQTAREYLAAGFAACIGFGPKATREYLSVWEDAMAAKNEEERKKTYSTTRRRRKSRRKNANLKTWKKKL